MSYQHNSGPIVTERRPISGDCLLPELTTEFWLGIMLGRFLRDLGDPLVLQESFFIAKINDFIRFFDSLPYNIGPDYVDYFTLGLMVLCLMLLHSLQV